MGMFDTVRFTCPSCNRRFEEQTKAGACSLANYDAEKGVPPEIAAAFLEDTVACPYCWDMFSVKAPDLQKRVPLVLEEIPDEEEKDDNDR